MKLVFLVITIFINFFNQSLIKSAENIGSANNKIENIEVKETTTEDKTEISNIHIVKTGDTISSISKYYSINKDLIIKLNNLKDENYIFVGQNLIISHPSKNPSAKSGLENNYHIVQVGESLTEISNKYRLNLGLLIEINDLKDPNSIKVGQKLLLSRNNPIRSKYSSIIRNKNNNKLLKLDKQIYGPIIIQSKFYEEIKGKKFLNILNQENKKLILSINCSKDELDLRIPGRKWMGGKPAKEKFEKNLINDFC